MVTQMNKLGKMVVIMEYQIQWMMRMTQGWMKHHPVLFNFLPDLIMMKEKKMTLITIVTMLMMTYHLYSLGHSLMHRIIMARSQSKVTHAHSLGF